MKKTIVIDYPEADEDKLSEFIFTLVGLCEVFGVGCLEIKEMKEVKEP